MNQEIFVVIGDENPQDLGRQYDTLLEPAGRFGERAQGLAEAEPLCGLSVMRILTPGDRNIRRIGSFQSPCSLRVVATEVICASITLGDRLLGSSETAGWEKLRRSRS